MYIDEEKRPLVTRTQEQSRGKINNILYIVGGLVLGVLIGTIATSWMWRSELEDQQKNNNNYITHYDSPRTSVVKTATASVGLNQTFSSRMNTEDIMTILQKIQYITNDNGGSRAAGSLGYNVTGQWIIDTLNRYDYFKVVRQDFNFTRYTQLAQPTLTHVSSNPVIFTYGTDFVDFEFSGSGDVTADISVVQNVGCDEVDWAEFPQGNIALVMEGDCEFKQKTAHAMAAKASALLIYSNTSKDALTNVSTLDSVTFPVLYLNNQIGQSLVNSCATQTVTLRVTASGEKTTVGTFNIIADTLAGPASPVVVVGAHLDSVSAGPGINDNGSGTATLLALARIVAETKMFHQDSPAQLRLAWWGAEERGLLGSYHYVNDLKRNHPDQFAQIALNLNFDMIGSVNFVRGIHNGTTAPEDVRHGCVVIQELFESYFNSQGLPFMLLSLNAGSDYWSFVERGIPASGVFTGAGRLKTKEQQEIFGGLAGIPYDPCYHKACDTIDNIDTQILSENAQAAAEVTAIVLFNPSILIDINPNVVQNRLSRRPIVA